MTAAYLDLYIDKGTTFNNTVTITDDITSNVVNIATYTISASMKKSYYSNTVNAITIPCSISDAANGVFTMSLQAGNTANLDGRYYYQVFTTANNVTNRILEGKVIVEPSVLKG